MGRTIIQPIGPLYGEAVNGTVFGRPNGSIYVPSVNTIKLSLVETYRYIYAVSATSIRVCTSSGTTSLDQANYMNAIAESQDLSNNMEYQLFSDAECTTLIGKNTMPAGTFNNVPKRDLQAVDSPTITAGTTYYLRAALLNNTNPVAYSDVIEVVGYEL